MALLFISHDLAVVSRMVERIVVMQGGDVVEEGPVMQVVREPRHPYTAALVASARALDAALDAAGPAEGGREMSILELRSAGFSYGTQTVLDDVSLEIGTGESLGLVGESGAGKSTILRLLLGLAAPPSGDGPVRRRAPAAPRSRAHAPVPAQRCSRCSRTRTPHSTRGSASTASWPNRCGRSGSRGVPTSGRGSRQRSIGRTWMPTPPTRYPHEFSGGQRQRIAIARAIVSRPRVLLADEPVSALDVTTRVQVIDLLARLQHEYGLALVMVSHDLGAVAAVCERTVVLRAGRVVEAGLTRTLLSAPSTDYARTLVGSVPRLPR